MGPSVVGLRTIRTPRERQLTRFRLIRHRISHYITLCPPKPARFPCVPSRADILLLSGVAVYY